MGHAGETSAELMVGLWWIMWTNNHSRVLLQAVLEQYCFMCV